ncbi:MAG: hypothetical protein Q9183_005283, partial [Haloplaca sp. 2 TL-2023]
WMMPDLNLRIYKAGFATTQQTYKHHARTVFAALDRLEAYLYTQTKILISTSSAPTKSPRST